MEDNIGKYHVIDNFVCDSAGTLAPEASDCRSVYEVIRIIDRVPLFFEDHYLRLTDSMKSIGGVLETSAAALKKQMGTLLSANCCDNCNVKIITSITDKGQSNLLYVSKSYYPSAAEIDTGVATGLLRLERNNPNVKLINRSYKVTVAARICEGGFFEVLLVDNQGNITEGSKSNVFFVTGGRILTAPASHVLKGITRKYVFEACRAAGCEAAEEFIGIEGLERLEGLFLSGTSIKVLPVSNIDARVYKSASNIVIEAVRMEFDKLIGKYIDANVKIW